MEHFPRRHPSTSVAEPSLSRRQFIMRSAQVLGGSVAALALSGMYGRAASAYANTGSRRDLTVNPLAATDTSAPPVPGQYAALAAELGTRMTTEVAYLSTLTPQPVMAHTYAAGLCTADSNRVTGLLDKYVMTGIDNELDTLQTLGVNAVQLVVAYPLLDPSFPNNAGYLNFYMQVAADIKQRGMTLGIANGILRSDPGNYGGVSYSSLTVDSFFAGLTAQALLVSQNMTPDYCTLGNEPTNAQRLTGLSFDATRFTQYINDTLAQVPRGTIQYGAGTGSWEDLSYWNSLMANTSVENGDIHIYPLATAGNDFFQIAAQMTDTARANGKGVVVTQCSLYKLSTTDIPNQITTSSVLARDIYDFWQPYDAQFLYLMQQFCQVTGIKFMSYVSSKYLHQAYVPYNLLTQNYTFWQGLLATGTNLLTSIFNKSYSATGYAYSQITGGS